jgi:FixJ family two-component response regulator
MGVRQTVGTLVSIVDDDASVRRALRRLVESAGFAVETFASGREVLDVDLGEPPACLVVDLHLGDMTGLDLHRQLLDSGVRIPLVLITAHDDSFAEERARRMGAVAYLRKPIDGAVLLDAIQRAVQNTPPGH